MDYEDAFTLISVFGQKTWNDNEIKKCQLVQNAQNIGLVGTVFDSNTREKVKNVLA